jgi:hypothetical protein
VYGCTPHGAVDCGNGFCNPGQQCSRGGGCIPTGTVDCGSGRYCPSGNICWTASASIGGIKRGELKCGSPDEIASLERQIAREKEERLAKERQEREEKKKAADEAKFKADAPARKKVSELLKDTVDMKRQVELAKLAQIQTKQELERAKAGVHYGCALLEQQAIARGDNPATMPGNVLCRSSGYVFGSQPTSIIPKRVPSGTLVVAPAPAALTKQQYDYLKANVATLQPEQRKVGLPLAAPVAPIGPSALATFMCGAPPNQHPCPPATIEAYRKTATMTYSQLGVSQEAILDRLEERHRKGLEYVRDSPEVKAALLSIQAKSAGLAVGGPVGREIAGNALLVKSAFEGVNEFRQGKHYEGTLRAINEVSSFAVDKLGLPPGSSDALNLVFCV